MWHPIETAPKDGTEILAYIAYETWEKKIEIVYYDDSYRKHNKLKPSWVSARCVDGLEAGIPTHWMPLPEPPSDV